MKLNVANNIKYVYFLLKKKVLYIYTVHFKKFINMILKYSKTNLYQIKFLIFRTKYLQLYFVLVYNGLNVYFTDWIRARPPPGDVLV